MSNQWYTVVHWRYYLNNRLLYKVRELNKLLKTVIILFPPWYKIVFLVLNIWLCEWHIQYYCICYCSLVGVIGLCLFLILTKMLIRFNTGVFFPKGNCLLRFLLLEFFIVFLTLQIVFFC